MAVKSKTLLASKNDLLLAENTSFENTDPIKSIFISNNDEYFALVSGFEVKVYSARNPGEARVFGLPKPKYVSNPDDDEDLGNSDDLL